MPRPSAPDRHGILLIDKPSGWTSHDVVGRLRRLLQMKRIGHAGTLDPFATGLLIVATGKATRLLRFAQDQAKTYLAHIVLGVTTDSDDRDGAITSTKPVIQWPAFEDVAAAIRQFEGPIEQRPPAYSAIRVDGRRAYSRARAGEEVEVPVRSVHVYEIAIIDYSPPGVTLRIRCSSGTYIRSIARDLGEILQTGAYCHELRRIESGHFSEKAAWTIDELESELERLDWTRIACHPDAAVWHLPAIQLDLGDDRAWQHGQTLGLQATQHLEHEFRVYTHSGAFAGIGTHADGNSLRPSIVFPTGQEGLDNT